MSGKKQDSLVSYKESLKGSKLEKSKTGSSTDSVDLSNLAFTQTGQVISSPDKPSGSSGTSKTKK